MKSMSSVFRNLFRRDKNQHIIQSEINSLEAIPRITLDADNLLSHKAVMMGEIFNSTEIEKIWDGVFLQIEPYAIPDGTGGVNPGDRRAIFYLTYSLRRAAVLEIGTHIGASTLMLAAAISKVKEIENRPPLLISVDRVDVNSKDARPWLQFGVKKSPLEMIVELDFSSFVDFVVDDSLHYMRECKNKFDFIFLDGDHSASTVYQEIPLALKLLNPGGVILLHDYFPDAKPIWSNGSVIPGPFLAVKRHIVEGAPLVAIPLGELPWLTKLHSKTTSLAMLLKNDTTGGARLK